MVHPHSHSSEDSPEASVLPVEAEMVLNGPRHSHTLFYIVAPLRAFSMVASLHGTAAVPLRDRPRVVRLAELIIGRKLLSLQDIYLKQCPKRPKKICKINVSIQMGLKSSHHCRVGQKTAGKLVCNSLSKEMRKKNNMAEEDKNKITEK